MTREYLTPAKRRELLASLDAQLLEKPNLFMQARRDHVAKVLAEDDAAHAAKLAAKEAARKAKREANDAAKAIIRAELMIAREAKAAASKDKKQAKRNERFDMRLPWGAGLDAEIEQLKVTRLREALARHNGSIVRAAEFLCITERQARYIAKKHAAPIPDISELLS